MQKLLMTLGVLSALNATTQVSVYDCGSINAVVTQNEVLAGGQGFYRPCIDFTAGNNYQFQGNVHKEVKALEYISIQENFHAGPFDQGKGMHLLIGEKSLYDIAVMNYPDLNTIQKFKKVEFGIDLEGELEERIKEFLEPGSFPGLDPLNPFIADDMNPLTSELVVHATFIHPATWTIKERDFFYYHEYEQVGTDWDDAINDNNDFLMRVRFAPPLPGEWETHVTVTVDGTTIQLPAFAFHVQDNNHPGYVKVHHNNRNLQRGTRLIMPVGHTFPGPYIGVKIWESSPTTTNKAADVAAWTDYLDQVQNYINQGGKFIKTCETSYGNLLEFEVLGNYLNRMHYAFENDKLLDICEENDVLIDFNLLFQDVFMTYGQSGNGEAWPWGPGYSPVLWDYGPYGPDGNLNPADSDGPNYAYYVEGTKPSNMFLDSNLMNYHKQRTRYYVARYGYTPQIYMWELLSEPWHLDQHDTHRPGETIGGVGTDIVISAVDNYYNQMSNYIKEDLGDTDHLILGCQYNIEGKFEPALFYNSVYNPNIDVVGVNFYGDRPDKLVKTKNENNKNNEVTAQEETQYKEVSRIHESVSYPLNKPLLLTEMGHGPDIGDCSYFTGDHVDAFTQGFTGVAGMYNWNGYDRPYDINQKIELWKHTIRAQNHMNGDDVVNTLDNWNGYWVQGRKEEHVFNGDDDIKELQYYVSQNNELAVGYVKNRTYNIHTQRNCNYCDCDKRDYSEWDDWRTATAVFWQTGPNIYVEGLQKNKDYRIDWYNFNGDYIETQCQNTTGNYRMKLKFPTLMPFPPTVPISTAAVWFVMKKQNCQGNKSILTEYEEEDVVEQLSERRNTQLHIYPNPFINELSIFSDRDDEIIVLSTEGIMLFQLSIHEGENTYQIIPLHTGMYFFKSKSTGRVIKVIKL